MLFCIHSGTINLSRIKERPLLLPLFLGEGELLTPLSSVSSCPVADAPLELPLFQLIPTQRQLVFRGDRLPLQCTASYLDPSVELRWLHDGRAVTTLEDGGVYVEETLLHDCCLLTRYSHRDGPKEPATGLMRDRSHNLPFCFQPLW